jgi:hypothetical protein
MMVEGAAGPKDNCCLSSRMIRIVTTDQDSSFRDRIFRTLRPFLIFGVYNISTFRDCPRHLS